eukprot:c242_g1_i1 orf=704-883(+)
MLSYLSRGWNSNSIQGKKGENALRKEHKLEIRNQEISSQEEEICKLGAKLFVHSYALYL